MIAKAENFIAPPRSLQLSAGKRCRLSLDSIPLSQGPMKKRRHNVKSKSVRFAEEKNTIRFRHATEADLKTSWLQDTDYRDIQQENRDTILAIKTANGDITKLDCTRACLRGLEHYIYFFVFQVGRHRQQDVVKNVLEHYRCLVRKGNFDDESLRNLSISLSKDDGFRARRIASLDAAGNFYYS